MYTYLNNCGPESIIFWEQLKELEKQRSLKAFGASKKLIGGNFPLRVEAFLDVESVDAGARLLAEKAFGESENLKQLRELESGEKWSATVIKHY